MIRSLFLIALLIHVTLAQKPALPNLPTAPQVPAPIKKWSTLSGL